MTGWLQRLTDVAVRRPALTLGLLAALAVAGGALATGLRPSASTDTFVSASSAPYRATVDEQRRFGEDAVVVLVRTPLTQLLAPGRLQTLTELEACLDGHTVAYDTTLRADVPASGAPVGGAGSPCGALARLRPAHVVYGPGTFLNRAVAAVNTGLATQLREARAAGDRAATAADRLARSRGASAATALADSSAARELEELRVLARLERSAVGSGLSGVPSVRDEAFVRRIVFGSSSSTGGAPAPRAQFAYLFPDADAALIQVRLRESLSAAAQARAIRLVRAAVAMPQFVTVSGSRAIVTGIPVVLADLAGQITGAIGTLLVAAVVVMAIVLLALFRPAAPRRRSLRLLPLLVALAAAGITFGVLSVAGVSLTLASVAVAPVLIGLGVDYSVQLQSRAADDAAGWVSGRAAPAIATAALATGVGFLVLLLSPVPMVRGFGVLLVLGVAVALACTLLAVPAALALADGRERRLDGALAASLRGAGELVGIVAAPMVASVRGAGEILGAGARSLAPSLRGAAELLHLPRDPDRVLGGVARHPGRVLAVGLVLAAAGWAVDGSTPVQSDVTRLVPQSTRSIRDLRTLEATTGTSGEIDVTVRGTDVATPSTIAWMRDYQASLLRHFGGAGGSCARATLCPALSLPDLFGATTTGADGGLTQARIDDLLAAVPGYFSSAVLTSDRREAELAFGIRLMPLARQQRVVEYMRSHLHPPAGVTAALTGLPVLAAQADAALSAPGRRLLQVAVGLLAVALVLLLVLRRPRRALVPMIPIVLATGWSALVLWVVGIPLNPMSATLGALVIAVSTEFSVLLSERFAEESEGGADPVAALRRTYRSTGRAVVTSGVTAIAGFGVLVVSDIAMLRDFGLVTLVDLTVSLAGVLLVLPAALVLRPRAGTATATSEEPAPSPRARWA